MTATATPTTPSERLDQRPATPVGETPEGFRVYEGVAAYGDVVMAYPDLNPPRVEFLPWSELSRPETVASLVAKPVAGASYLQPVGHPPSNRTRDDIKPHIEGTVMDAWADHDAKALRFRAVVYTAGLQDAIDGADGEDPVVEVSAGYFNDTDVTPGVFDGQRYDVVKRNLRFNHLIPVPEARNRRRDGEGARLDEAARKAACDATKEKVTPMDPEKMMPLSAAAVALLDQMPPADRKVLDDALALLASGAKPPAAPSPGTGTPDPTAAPDVDDPDGEQSGAIPAVDALAGLAAMADAANPDAPAAAAPPAGDTPPKTPAEINDEAAPMPAAGSNTTMDETKVSKMIADALKPMQDAIAKMGQPRADAAPAAPVAPIAVDLEAVKREAAATSSKAALDTFNAAGALVSQARMDGHDVHTTTQALGAMRKVVEDHLPVLLETFDGHLKAQRLDAAAPIYKQAQALRAADRERLDAEAAHVIGIHDRSHTRPLGVAAAAARHGRPSFADLDGVEG